MELHYIWIQKYGHLEEAGINLSSKYIIELKKKGDSKENFIMHFSKNNNFISNFFETENIINVNAIIGKNGSGKSSILNYIKNQMCDGQVARLKNDIFIYSELSIKGEEFFIIIPENINIDLKSKNETQIEINPIYYSNGGDLKFISNITKPHIIYYSYLLDFNEDSSKMKGISNISTSFLLMEERVRIKDESTDGIEMAELLVKTNDLDNLHYSEVTKAAELISSDFEDLPFAKPEFINIEIDLSNRIHFLNPKNGSDEIKHINTILEELEKKIAKEDSIGKIKNNFSLAIFLNYLIIEYKYSSQDIYKNNFNIPKGESVIDYIKHFFLRMRGGAFYYKGQFATSEKHDSLSYLVVDMLEKFDHLVDNNIIKFSNDTNFIFLINKDTEDYFKRFINDYKNLRSFNRFLKFRWRNLSGGEQSYLSFMSRFYDIKVNSINSLPPDLFILIDEGDIGYHPEWQRTFFNKTIHFLSKLFKDHKLQIIFTSNTPFLSSDLTNSNVLFLEYIDRKKTIIHSKLNNRHSTFAANIHTLFSDSLYMDGILIGQFAKNKIDKIIKYLKGEINYPLDSTENVKRTIDEIGEPILKNKLLEMWFKKFDVDYDDEISILENRILELKMKKKYNKE